MKLNGDLSIGYSGLNIILIVDEFMNYISRKKKFYKILRNMFSSIVIIKNNEACFMESKSWNLKNGKKENIYKRLTIIIKSLKQTFF